MEMVTKIKVLASGLIITLLLTGCNVNYIYPVKEIEVIKEVPAEAYIVPRHFQSIEELENWLGSFEVPVFNDWSCVNYALDLQERGLKDGYIINFKSSSYEYYNWFFTRLVLVEPGAHAYNSTRIGGRMYFVEPQNHEISRAGDFLN